MGGKRDEAMEIENGSYREIQERKRIVWVFFGSFLGSFGWIGGGLTWILQPFIWSWGRAVNWGNEG